MQDRVERAVRQILRRDGLRHLEIYNPSKGNWVSVASQKEPYAGIPDDGGSWVFQERRASGWKSLKPEYPKECTPVATDVVFPG